jgi:hypothetical protein
MASITLTVSTRAEGSIGGNILGTTDISVANHKALSKIEDPEGKYLDITPSGFKKKAGVYVTECLSDYNDIVFEEASRLHYDHHMLKRMSKEELALPEEERPWCKRECRGTLVAIYDEDSDEKIIKKGPQPVTTVYNIKRLKAIKSLVKKISRYLNEKMGIDVHYKSLTVEINYYEDLDNSYIGFHGDKERNFVFGYRCSMSDTMPIYFGAWENRRYIQGSMKALVLSPGDSYIMSEHAVGTDWSGSSNIKHYRHAAGNLLTMLAQNAWKPIEKEPLYITCLKKDIEVLYGSRKALFREYKKYIIKQDDSFSGTGSKRLIALYNKYVSTKKERAFVKFYEDEQLKTNWR